MLGIIHCFHEKLLAYALKNNDYSSGASGQLYYDTNYFYFISKFGPV